MTRFIASPFMYQGQYYDKEIELAYNRFRYYDPEDGRYISVDPIGLESGEYGFYNYVNDPNGWVDVLGFNGRRGNQATRDHIDVVKKQFLKDNPGSKHTGGGTKGGKPLKETYIRPTNPTPGSTKGGFYSDLTFITASGKIVHINTVDKGNYLQSGMSKREYINAERIKRDAPNSKVITIRKGDKAGNLGVDKKKKSY